MSRRPADRSRTKRYTIRLTECELRRLTAYAASCHTDRPSALMRLVRRSLREVEAAVPALENNENQLRLFDVLQIDIFNNTAKVTNSD